MDRTNMLEKNYQYSVKRGELQTSLVQVGSPVPYVVLLPPSYDPDRHEPYPLLLFLHGGSGTAEEVLWIKPMLEAEAGPEGSLAQFVAVCFSCPGKNPNNVAGGQYIDYLDGSQNWNKFAVEEFLPHIRRNYHVGGEKTGRTVVMGASMGGAGALRISFRQPELFVAAAALEPHIHGALSFYQLNAHQRAIETPHDAPPLDGDAEGYSGELCGIIREEAYGNPVDDHHWCAWQPACIAVADPEQLKESKLQIYLECGDRDEFEFNFATEYLHRVLLDLGVEHDYHLLRGVNHYGSDLERRLYNALEFLSVQLMPGKKEPPDIVQIQKRIKHDAESRKRSAGYKEQTIQEKYRGVCGSFIAQRRKKVD